MFFFYIYTIFTHRSTEVLKVTEAGQSTIRLITFACDKLLFLTRLLLLLVFCSLICLVKDKLVEACMDIQGWGCVSRAAEVSEVDLERANAVWTLVPPYIS